MKNNIWGFAVENEMEFRIGNEEKRKEWSKLSYKLGFDPETVWKIIWLPLQDSSKIIYFQKSQIYLYYNNIIYLHSNKLI